MGAITHSPAESVLIDLMEGHEDWRAEARAALIAHGLPTRRVEAWKYSDLKRAAEGASEAGEAVYEMVGGGLDSSRHELNFSASAGIGIASRSLTVPSGAETVLVENRTAAPGAFAMARLEIVIEPGAKLTHVISADEAEDSVSVHRLRVELAEGARYAQTALSFGSKLTRQETRIAHAGEGAEAVLSAVYLLGAGRHADFTSIVTHKGPGGVTQQLVKGAASRGGKGVFQGKFEVERAAQKTDARMSHRALMLEPGAEIDSKPELEIYADDVQCAHGNALGALDESALFYLRQRGIPAAKARALLIESHLAEPLQAIEDEGLRDALLARLRARLEALS